ncbi:MAG: ABC transporter permease [Actinomycetota bacterium]|nr:ABC transporter permease [Actinomycetota bacterium]
MSVRTVFLLLSKDLRGLRRSPAVLATLVAYPLALALLVGLVADYAVAKPRVALVDEDGLPAVVSIGGARFHVDRTIRRVASEVELVRLAPSEARSALRSGRVVAAVTVPRGFVADLRGMTESPTLRLELTRGPVSSHVRQQVHALVYALNRRLQRAYVAANLRYIGLIEHGGGGAFLGRSFEVLGLDGTEALLRQLPPSSERDRIEAFVATARLALSQAGASLRATANPIELREVEARGRTSILSAEIQADALALTIAFLALVVAAGALAAERDENVLGRLTRGLVSYEELAAAKIALAAVLSLVVGGALAVAFGGAVELAGAVGGEPWGRLPVLLAGIALAGASVGALGVLLGAVARDARTASLLSLLVVLPLVFLGLIPREVVPVAGVMSDAFPFAHAVRLFSSVLFEPSPWESVAREALWLAALGGLFAVLARASMRRLAE